MAIYCDLTMDAETALELLKFVQAHRVSEPALVQLFSDIERQISDSLAYEAEYIPGTLRKSERH